MEDKKLMRSTSDKMIAGVCGGLAQYFGLDAIIVRIIFVVLLITGSLGFWLYIILWVVMPEDTKMMAEAAPAAEPPATDDAES